MLGPLTYLDVGVIALCALSGLLAMARGLTRELLSIVSWVVAAAAAAWVFFTQQAMAKQLADQLFQSTMLALIVMCVAVFVVVLIVVHFITIKLSDGILESGVGLIDRILGLGFGIARGFLLVVIAYLFFQFLVEEQNQPDWVSNAKSIGYVKSTAIVVQQALEGFLPENLELPGFGDVGTQQG